ncbi:exo-alpha-sialidase, partial [Candidatus Aminicenantes bacterium AC-334-K16]|nr:exo-alpha-sialidase [Candidatus Aminicenantes bacterium AC-334-K16]
YFIETLLNRQIYVLLMTPNPMRWTHHLKRIFNQAPYNRRFPRGINVLLRNYAWAVRNLSREFSLPLVDVFRLLETREINGEGEVNSLLSDGIHPNDLGHELIATWLSAKIKEIIFSPQKKPSRHLPPSSQPPGFQIPIIDLSRHGKIQVVVDKENGQYLGHPTTVLLEDGRTIIVVYPKGHGRGAVVMKKSSDGGRTWSPRLPVPSSWATSREVPTIFRTIDSTGKKRLILFSGLYPIRMSISEDDGLTWSELKPIGPFGGIVAMASCIPLRTGPGHYLAMFHDDGRFIQGNGQPKGQFTLYQCFSEDGGLTWSAPQPVYSSSIFHLCEAGLIRSPDGRQIAALLRENSRRYNSLIILSNNEGKTWSAPRELPGSLTGDRHTGKYLPDGRLFISFRDISPDRGSPTEGDWVAWVGNYDDLVNGREGQYRLRLMDNHHAWDCGYPGVEILPNGTIVAVSYGHWQEEEPPYIVAVRFKLRLADRIYKRLTEKNN